MPSRFENYRFRDGPPSAGGTRLDAATFNPRWADIDARIGALESISSSLSAAIAALTDEGLQAIQDRIYPLIDEAEATLAELIALRATLDHPAMLGQLNAQTGHAGLTSVTYTAEGLTETVTEQIDVGDGVTESQVTTFTYGAENRIALVTTDFMGVRRTETFGYDGVGMISSITASEGPIPE